MPSPLKNWQYKGGKMLRILLMLKIKSLKAELQYPVNFVIGLLGTSFIGLTDILLLLIPVSTFQTIGGWNFWELGFMFSLWKMSHGLHEALFIPFRGRHDDFIRNGDYDLFLIRPIHPILQILARCEFGSNAFSEWLPSVTMFFITCSKVTIVWNPMNIAFLLILIISGAVIEWAVYLFLSSFGFWVVRTNNLRGIAGVFLFRVANYPLHIYGRIFPWIMTFVFPFAFMAYFPTHYFFGLEVKLYSSWFPYLSPLIAVIAISVAMIFWTIGLKNYQSTGT
jgi:ABC-2 type transport system permease protein